MKRNFNNREESCFASDDCNTEMHFKPRDCAKQRVLFVCREMISRGTAIYSRTGCRIEATSAVIV